jgi:hypothetical protein
VVAPVHVRAIRAEKADGAASLGEIAAFLKLDIEAIAAKVKQEFAAEAKATIALKDVPKSLAEPQTKVSKESGAA